jgi:DNA-binding SARP family transcriptional activator/TolB-like protein/tetratricopeptide (TPR) repeat protein
MQESVRIQLRVLGPFAIVVEGAETRDFRVTSRKGRALIAYLAMHPDQSLSREHLATFLWGDRSDSNARQCLRQCLLSLRQDFGPAVTNILRTNADRIGLNWQCVAVDAVEFRARAQSSVESDLTLAADLCRGEFLADLNLEEPFDAWVRKTRNELGNLAADVFQSCATRADAREDSKGALIAVERLTELDVLREDWQRLALHIYARYRGRTFAMKYAESIAARLTTELGVDPEPATIALIEGISRGEIAAVSPSLPPLPDTKGADARADGTFVMDPVVGRATGDSQYAHRSAFWRVAVSRVLDYAARTSLQTGLSLALAILIGTSALVYLGVDRLALNLGHGATGLAGRLSSAAIVPHRNVDSGPIVADGLVSIVVLPFTTGGDAKGENQKISDGITDDIINVLSRSEMMRVISRQTAFTYQGRSVDAGALGAELGVRYVVEGSVKHAGSKFIINVDLVDTTDRLQVWADRIEWDASDGGTAPDELAARIGNELRIGAGAAEGARVALNHTGEPDLEALLAQGLAAHYRGLSRENLAEELALFEDAMRREPDLEPAMIGVAMSLTTGVLNSLSDQPDVDLNRADDLLDRAMQMNPESYRVYFWKGLVFRAQRNYEAAYDMLSKSINLNPTAIYAHAHLGNVLVKLGRAQEGLEHIRLAIRLSPRNPFAAQFEISAAEAEVELHHEEAAIEWLRSAVASQPHNPSAYKYLAATYALLGHKQEAERYWDEFRRLSAAPGLGRTVDRVKAAVAGSFPRAPSRLIQGLALVSQYRNS